MATSKNGKVITSKAEKPFKGARKSRAMKTRKMIQPRCPTHFPGDNSVSPFANWVEGCKADGHNPYVTATAIDRTIPNLVERDGKTFIEGETVEREYIETPNWEQVPDELGMWSGRGVANSIQRGFVFPEDLGYAPFCDYFNCGEQNPKFRTRFGDYHNREEASLIAMRLDFGQHNETEVQFTEVDGRRWNRQIRDKAAEEGIR